MINVTCFSRMFAKNEGREALLPLVEKKADEESKSQEPCRLTQGKTHTCRKTRIFTVIP